MRLPQRIADAIIAHALEDNPNECCGVLAGVDGAILRQFRMTNMAKSPFRYEMDGKELLSVLQELDRVGWELMAIYHSHTHSPAYPSDTDLRLASWPDAFYILVSLQDHQRPELRSYLIVDGVADEQPVELIP